MKTSYFVVAAPGHYGDRTRVVSSHKNATLAKRAARKLGPGFVVREGGKKRGDVFVAASGSIFRIVAWSA